MVVGVGEKRRRQLEFLGLLAPDVGSGVGKGERRRTVVFFLEFRSFGNLWRGTRTLALIPKIDVELNTKLENLGFWI